MIITIANQKGGVCKTTTALALGQGLTEKGYKVLFVDTDTQGNLTNTIGQDTENAPTVADLLSNTRSHEEATKRDKKWHIIPSDYQTAIYQHKTPTNAIKLILEPIKNNYDFIIIDTPPTLSSLTISSICASDTIIIPTTASTYSLQGIKQLYQTIEQCREMQPTLSIDGILLTKYTDRSIINRQIKNALEDMAKSIGTKVYKTTIRQTIAIEEAQAMQEPIFDYCPKATATTDYKAFIKEFLRSVK